MRLVALLVILALLAPLAPAASAPKITTRILDAPAEFLATGAPFNVTLALAGPPNATIEARVEVVAGASVLSESWNGIAWQPGAKYAATRMIGANGSLAVTMMLRVGSRDAANATLALLANARVVRGTAGPTDARPIAARLPPPPPRRFFSPIALDGAPVVAYTAPESSYAALSAFLGRANRSLDLSLYTLTSYDLARLVADAADRGARVRIALDADPVGGVPAGERALLAALAARGAEVRGVSAAEFASFHAKYAVRDGQELDVGSENWVASAYPPASAGANRGWGLVVANASLAATFDSVFTEDFARAAKFDTRGAAPATLLPAARATGAAPLALTVAANVTPVFAPENSLASSTLLGALAAANRSIELEELELQVAWHGASSPFLEAVARAAGRGVVVRALADASVSDNTAGLERLAGAGADARAMDANVTLHNKGIVVDGRIVFVGSLNWAYASAVDNREAGLLVDSATLARYYERAFEKDWNASAPLGAFPPAAHAKRIPVGGADLVL
ncbi:MAG: phospholipase D-like domain-containing protein, partial [Thermoplasmatota archaeon]